MTLRYGTYLDLLSALDEFTKCEFEKYTLQNLIFERFIGKYHSFYAENSKRIIRYFTTKIGSKNIKSERKSFRNFMNK